MCRTWWRRKVSFMYAHVCLRSTHAFKAEWPNPQTLNTPSLLNKPRFWSLYFCTKPSIGQLPQQTSMELHYSNSYQQFSAYIYSTHVLTSNPFWVGPQAPQPLFVYQPTCTTLRLTHAHNQMNRVSGVDSTSLRGGPEWHTHWMCANVPFLKQTPDTMQTMH